MRAKKAVDLEKVAREKAVLSDAGGEESGAKKGSSLELAMVLDVITD